jgi:hypothetical protein
MPAVKKAKAKAIVPTASKVVVMDTTERLIEAMIKAAANPDVEVAKMKELVALKDQMEERAARIAFDENLALMQAELPQIDKKGRIIVRRKDLRTGERTGPVEQSTGYAKWEHIDDIIRPILYKYGFSLSFRSGVNANGLITVTAILARGGHREENTMTVQHDATGSKNPVQAVGSSTSYGKRYAAGLLLNIVTRGEDDDGASFKEHRNVTQKQLAELIALADEVKADKARFCALFKVDSFAEIPALRFEEAKTQLLRKKKARAKATAAATEESDFPGDKPMPKTQPPRNEFS